MVLDFGIFDKMLIAYALAASKIIKINLTEVSSTSSCFATP